MNKKKKKVKETRSLQSRSRRHAIETAKPNDLEMISESRAVKFKHRTIEEKPKLKLWFISNVSRIFDTYFIADYRIHSLRPLVSGL